MFFDYLQNVARFVPPVEEGKIKYANKLDFHEFIRREIQRAPEHVNPYGLRTNWGEKVFVVIDRDTRMVINMPTGYYNTDPYFPTRDDIMGLERMIVTLPSLVSKKYEGALYPIELVNGIASMSSYPSAKILQGLCKRDMLG